MANNNPFEGIESAQIARGGVYFVPGTYKVEVKAVKLVPSRKKDNLFIVETKVLESDSSERPAGCCPSQVINFKHDAALGNVKAFVAACLGIDASREEGRANEEVTSDLCMAACSEDQPFMGVVLNLTCVNTETRAGNDFTLHTWSPSDEHLKLLAGMEAA